jgi:phosphorylcholine metabolism protein LicD
MMKRKGDDQSSQVKETMESCTHQIPFVVSDDDLSVSSQDEQSLDQNENIMDIEPLDYRLDWSVELEETVIEFLQLDSSLIPNRDQTPTPPPLHPPTRQDDKSKKMKKSRR